MFTPAWIKSISQSTHKWRRLRKLDPLPSPPLFSSPISQALYELATSTRSNDPEYRPHPKALNHIMENGQIAPWENWQGLALHDNVVFPGARATQFTLNALRHNAASDYFYVYLLNLYQKVRLSLFAGELMRRDTDFYKNIAYARSLWERFLIFRSRYCLAEITLKSRGMKLYQSFQRGLNAKSLFLSTSKEVTELHRYFERQEELAIQESAAKMSEDIHENIALVATVQKRVEWMVNVRIVSHGNDAA